MVIPVIFLYQEIASDILARMTKRVTDLAADELNTLASEAWSAAAKDALAQGFSVTGSREGRRVRYNPDGRIEDLGPTETHFAQAKDLESR